MQLFKFYKFVRFYLKFQLSLHFQNLFRTLHLAKFLLIVFRLLWNLQRNKKIFINLSIRFYLASLSLTFNALIDFDYTFFLLLFMIFELESRLWFFFPFWYLWWKLDCLCFAISIKRASRSNRRTNAGQFSIIINYSFILPSLDFFSFDLDLILFGCETWWGKMRNNCYHNALAEFSS